MDGEALMRTIVAGFEKSDLQPLMNALHPDVVWKSASRHEGSPFSFAGDHKNRAGILAVLSHISRDYTFHRMVPVEIMSRGELVWGQFDVTLRYDPKGKGAASKTLRMDWVLHWRIRDGKIIEHQAFFDTAYLLQQQGGLQA